MNAPSTLLAEHGRQAIAEIDRHGLPPPRGSTKYELVVDGKRYPPKYTLGLATGRTLRADAHYGGEQSNGRLRDVARRADTGLPRLVLRRKFHKIAWPVRRTGLLNRWWLDPAGAARFADAVMVALTQRREGYQHGKLLVQIMHDGHGIRVGPLRS